MSLNRRIVHILAVAFGMLPCAQFCFASSAWVQRKVASRQFPIRTVCIMPAEAGVTKFGLKTPEEMQKESADWALALQALVQSHFKNVGVQFVSATGAFGSGASDAEIGQVVQQLQEKYDALSAVLNKKPKEIAKGAYTLTDEVAMLPCAASSDVVVFIRGAGAVPSEGRTAVGLVGGVVITSNAVVVVTFVDAKTGEVLAMTRFHNADDDFLSNEEDAFGFPLDEGLAIINLGSARKVEAAHEFGPGSH